MVADRFGAWMLMVASGAAGIRAVVWRSADDQSLHGGQRDDDGCCAHFGGTP